MTIATIGLTFMGKVDPKDFMMLAGMVFAFYFSYKGSTGTTSSTTTSTSETPANAGK